jgi:hypothetical protein
MDIIKFLKPDLAKFIIFLIISVSILYIANFVFTPHITSYSYPLPFATTGRISDGPGTPVMLTVDYNWLNHLINLFIYYLVSCLIVYAYRLVKK